MTSDGDVPRFTPAQPDERQFAPPAPAESVPALKLLIKGFTPFELRLLDSVVKISQRRTPRLELLDDARANAADVVMIDSRDADAIAWASRRKTWLDNVTVIWVDAAVARNGHTMVARPVQWPALPMLLARALDNGHALKPKEALLPDASAVARAASPTTPAGGAVLVVDDSLAVRGYLRSLLEQQGFAVDDADSVEAALDLVKQKTFDCALMDVLMPGADGYEGCRRIKALLRGDAGVPVVMLTSKSSPFDRIRGKMAGCDAYLTKPIDPERLKEVLAEQVRPRSSRPAPASRAAAHAPGSMLRAPPQLG